MKIEEVKPYIDLFGFKECISDLTGKISWAAYNRIQDSTTILVDWDVFGYVTKCIVSNKDNTVDQINYTNLKDFQGDPRFRKNLRKEKLKKLNLSDPFH